MSKIITPIINIGVIIFFIKLYIMSNHKNKKEMM